MGAFIDLSGQRFGKLIVLKRANITGRNVYWICQCDCGRVYEVQGGGLRNGKSSQCKHCANTIHGMNGTKIYRAWYQMKDRCLRSNHPRYKDWGGRGITIEDKRWLIFENFYADMGDIPEGKTLDRINNNKGYYKENCRWATPKEQAQNRRKRILENV